MKRPKLYARQFFTAIICLVTVLSVYSCNKKSGMDQAINSSTDTTKNFLALGDSYTIGESVSANERFPNQTVDLLTGENITEPDIIAVTGWTTTNLLNALNLQPPAKTYSVVSLLIGVNNQYQRRNIDEYKREFTLLLTMSIQYAANNKNHVFVLSIPDYSVTPFAAGSDQKKIADEIDSFNAVNKTISAQLGVNYLDITAVSREAANDPGLTANDGLHPSAKQYKKWAELLAPLIRKQLQ